jgi:hypothetical protein
MTRPSSLVQYAAQRARQGSRVLPGDAGTFWVEHEARGLVRIPPFLVGPPARGEVRQVLWASRCAVATYLLPPDAMRPANAWLYLCTDQAYDLDKLVPAVRRNVRRGLRELTVTALSPADLLAHGAQAFADTRRRVGLADGTPREFTRRFRLRAACGGHSFLGAWNADRLAAFLSLTEVDDWVEIEGSFSVTELLPLRPNDALMYRALSQYLVEERRRVVAYGLSSIQAESNAVGLHAFKTKMGFEARPVHRAFALHPALTPFANRLGQVGLGVLLWLWPHQRQLKKAEGVLASVLGDARLPAASAAEAG